jgi:membrane protein YqaA with SNARE-associated domain
MSECTEAAAARETREISSRRWILSFAAFLLAAGALFAASREIESLARIEVLMILLLYTSVACTFLPLPTAWIVLWAAREANPVGVALTAAAGTCIANLHDYYILNYLLGLRRVGRVKKTGLYRSAAGWFGRAPFATLCAASFVPIPVDVVRILAVSTGYSRLRYTLASFAGRFPRYLILAWLGYELELSNRAILIVFAATVLVGAVKGLSKIRERRVHDDQSGE